MIPLNDDIKLTANIFANERFNYTVKGVAMSSFFEGAEWVISKLCDGDDATQRLSHDFGTLKVQHWRLKNELEYIKRENRQLRKNNKELLTKFFDAVELYNNKYLLTKS